MSVYVIWRTSRPTGGLGEAMQRIAIQVASEGEYTSVEILYAWKDSDYYPNTSLTPSP